MKRLLGGLLISACLSPLGWAADDRAAVTERVQRAADVLNEIMAAPDKGIPGDVYQHAKCVAVIPALKKGAFVFGAEHGKGVATCRTENGWSAPDFFSLTGGSWGAQIGGAEVDLVMLIMNDKGMQQLLSSKFELGGDANVAAGPVGRDASGNTDWKMGAEVLTYSRSKGVFAGISLKGAAIHQDEEATQAFYGQPETTKTLLTGGVPPPAAARPFLQAVAHNKAVAAESH
jgi:lipid-binding SYLF domain-containing protein